ncbi:sugar phosphate permease [Desulfuromonas soudanensis]|uniref:Sugar phosphate permease n=1 Tax=Desulfuromonas soudanensis TaxID=1603606 RepID=A0A0M3QEV0_9BACT|nr:MFS transporter [Desulfuromonas soudanensis]ALC15119.1 sugar phosphate permease [Desulfuromonas soudanensis]
MPSRTQDRPPFDPSRFLMARWSIFSILIAAYMLVFFHRMAPAVVSGDLMRAFGTTGVALGSLAAMYFYIYTLMQIPAGILADTLGARITVAVGNLVAGSGSILFGLGETFTQAAVGRALVGLGVSVVFVGLFKSNSVWFSDRHYGRISGLTLLLGNVGAIASAGPLAALLGFYSWRTVFVALGVLTLLLAALTLLLVRNSPEDLGFPSLREMEGRTSHARLQNPWYRELLGVVRARATWPLFWVDFGMVGSMLAFVGLWAIPCLRDTQGLDRGAASLYTTLALAGFATGSMAAGWISDRIGYRKPVIVAGSLGYLLVCLALALLPWAAGASGFLLFFLLGFCAGGFIVTFASAKEAIPPNLSGMAVGLVNTGLFLGAAIVQPLFGWIMDRGWDGTLIDGVRIYGAGDYRRGLLVLVVFAAVAFAGSLLVKETRCRNLTVED